MDKFFYKDELVAIRIAKINNGSNPVTPPKEPLQMVTLKHPRGTYLKAHTHRPKKRTTARLQECLIVKRGAVVTDLYGSDNVYFDSLTLKQGDALIVVGGGLAIHFSLDSELLEIKNGPFIEDKLLI